MGIGPASRNLVDRLDAWPRPATWMVLACACLALVSLDRLAPEIGMGPLYIPLIALAGWRLGPREACGVAVLAAFLNIFPHHADEAGLSPAQAAVRGVLRLGTYAFVVAMTCVLRRGYDRERTAARRDALTGALNRQAFEEQARDQLGRADVEGPTLVLALADLDGFKTVNDTRGHAAGDAVLRAFAGLAGTALAANDRLGRLGGDEFVLLLEAGTAEAARTRVEDLHRHLMAGLRGVTTPVTVSMGALVLPPGTGMDPAAATREADRLMYAAKTAGKGVLRIEEARVPAGRGARVAASLRASSAEGASFA